MSGLEWGQHYEVTDTQVGVVEDQEVDTTEAYRQFSESYPNAGDRAKASSLLWDIRTGKVYMESVFDRADSEEFAILTKSYELWYKQ